MASFNDIPRFNTTNANFSYNLEQKAFVPPSIKFHSLMTLPFGYDATANKYTTALGAMLELYPKVY